MLDEPRRQKLLQEDGEIPKLVIKFSKFVCGTNIRIWDAAIAARIIMAHKFLSKETQKEK